MLQIAWRDPPWSPLDPRLCPLDPCVPWAPRSLGSFGRHPRRMFRVIRLVTSWDSFLGVNRDLAETVVLERESKVSNSIRCAPAITKHAKVQTFASYPIERRSCTAMANNSWVAARDCCPHTAILSLTMMWLYVCNASSVRAIRRQLPQNNNKGPTDSWLEE